MAEALLTALGLTDARRMDGLVTSHRFPAEACLMAEGSVGDACYLVVEGEIRVEVTRADFDSDGVVGYVGPGELCGEFSLLDRTPRSASAYAHTDVVVRRLSADGLRALCRDDPAAGLQVVLALGRNAATRARQYAKHLQQFVFGDEVDASVDRTVAAASAAQESFEAWPEDKVDGLVAAVAEAVAARAGPLAADTVAETGVGNAADKTRKNRFASLDVAAWLIGKVGTGVWGTDDARGVTEIAAPSGVILGLVPMTNPVSTLVFKSLICLKSRNALIASVHHAARGVGADTATLIRQVLTDHGAPADLLQALPGRGPRRRTAMYMGHPSVSLVLATGGPGMVKAAYSSGTPAIGVGSGNAPAWICDDADVAAAARTVIDSKSFDHGVICGSENNLVVDSAVRARFDEALELSGAAVLDASEKARLTVHAFDEHGLSRRVLGQSAASIAATSGIVRQHPLRLLVAPADLGEVDGPWGREKLAPLLSLFTVAGEDEAMAVCLRLLGNGGTGHTAVVHTPDERRQRRYGLAMPASRILANAPAAQGCIGLGNGLTPSLTLGCGTFGGNSTTDNVSYTNLVNVKRMAGPLRAPAGAGGKDT